MQQDRPTSVSISVGGSNFGAIWSGDQNRVIVNAKTGATTTVPVDEVRSLADAIAKLRDQVAAQAPPDQRDAALKQIDKLQEAILPQPKLSRMQEVRDWFVKHAPSLIGSVTSIFINPILGKIVEATGEMAAASFTKRFG